LFGDDDQYRVYQAFNSGQNDLAYGLGWSAQALLDGAAPGLAPNATLDCYMWPMTLEEDCVAPQQGTYTYIDVRRTCLYFFLKLIALDHARQVYRQIWG
jgi:hypothetical protein